MLEGRPHVRRLHRHPQGPDRTLPVGNHLQGQLLLPAEREGTAGRGEHRDQERKRSAIEDGYGVPVQQRISAVPPGYQVGALLIH